MSREPIVEDGVIAGTYSEKYASRNPIARRLVAGFERAVLELVEHAGVADVHEAGCGEGHLTGLLARDGRRVRASDFSTQVLQEARRHAAAEGFDAEFTVRPVEALEPEVDSAELVVCCEVLEHVREPDVALERLAACARPWLLVSVPREPLWRAMNCARGRYLSDWGNTPGHLHHWSRRGFLRFLARRVDVVEVRSPIPWTVALCRSRS